MNSLKNKSNLAGLITSLVIFVFLIFASPCLAQLTDAEIDSLQARADREGWSFEVAKNPATDYSLDQLCGLVEPENWRENAPFDPCTVKRDLPASFDWRDSTTLPPARNQGGCGSCWAFGTVGPLECNIAIKDGILMDLSEQYLVSCNSNGWGCSGGWFAHSYHMSAPDPCGDAGAVREAVFPYVAYDASCNCPYEHTYTIESYAYVGNNYSVPSTEAIKQAILDHGPVSVAVTVNSSFQAYDGGVYDAMWTKNINHAVVLVGWDDNQGENGVWFMRNSWGPWWGEDGYMRIAYGCNDIGYGACYVVYNKSAKVDFEYQAGFPTWIHPEELDTMRVTVRGLLGGSVIPGSGMFHYSIEGSTFEAVPMNELYNNHYRVDMPDIPAGQFIEYYFSVMEETDGRVFDPDTSKEPFSAISGYAELTVFADDFEQELSWHVTGDASDGHWGRGVPVDNDRGDPPYDYDGSGKCYLTDNSAGSSDVDDGTATLISPTFDLSNGNGLISYARWYSNAGGDEPHTDEMQVYISNDDGVNWTPFETVGPLEEAEGGWYKREVWAGDYIALTDKMKLRFDASDLDAPSVVEAAVDAVKIRTFALEPVYICGDAGGDGQVNISDAVYIINYIFIPGSPEPDPLDAAEVNCDGNVNISDAVYIINYIFVGGAAPCDC